MDPLRPHRSGSLLLLCGPSVPEQAFVRGVSAAPYRLTEGRRSVQPLLVDVEWLAGTPGRASNWTDAKFSGGVLKRDAISSKLRCRR